MTCSKIQSTKPNFLGSTFLHLMSPRCMPCTPPCPYPTGEDCSPFFTTTNTWLELLKFQLGLSKVMTKTHSPWLSAHRKEKKKTLAFKLSNEREEARKYLLTEWCLDKSKLESNPPIFQSEGLSVRVLSLSHVHLFKTPWAAARQVPLSTVFFRQEYWSRLPFPTPGNLPDPKIEPASLASPALAGRFFTTGATYKANSWMFSSVHSLSHVWLFATPWTTARQASLSITNSQSPPKPMSIESVMPSNHLILCRPHLLPPSIFPSIRVFSNKSALHIRWQKYWSCSFNISPTNEHPGLWISHSF